MKVEIKDVVPDVMSETGVVGTILQHPEYVCNSDFLKPKHFTDRCLSGIYFVTLNLFTQGVEEIDSFIVSNEILSNKKYKSIYEEYGLKTVESLIEYVEDLRLVARSSIEEYKLLAKKVISNAFKRDASKKLIEIANDIVSSEDDINISNRKLQSTVSDFSSVYITNEEMKILGDKADKIMADIKRKQQRGFFGYPTLFKELDKYVSYTEEDMIVYQAKAKSYKSIILMNQAITLAVNGIPTFYVDTENSETLHFMRALSFLTGIEYAKVRDGNLSIAEEKLIAEKVELIKTLPYIHLYDNIADVDDIYTKCRTLSIRMGLKVLVHDYIKNTSNSTDDYNLLGQTTMKLKNLSGDLKLATISACQSNRNGDVGDSIKILRYISTMIKIERKTKEDMLKDGKDSGNLRLIVTDNRNGNSHLDGDWINLDADGDKCTVRQARNPIGSSDETPFDDKKN